MLKVILFCSLILSVSFAQSAWTPAFETAVSQLSGKEKRAFDQAMVSCLSYRNRSIKKFEFTPHEANVFLGTSGDVNYAANAILSEGWRTGSAVFRETQGIGMYLHELLNSYGFMLAMKKCFNNDTTKENLYVAELLLIDAAVKGVYMGGTYLTAKYLLARRWGVALITTLIVSPISGDSPKKQELSMLETLQEELRQVKEHVQLFTNKNQNLP